MKDLSQFDPAKAGFRFTPHVFRDNSCQPELSRRLYILLVIHINNCKKERTVIMKTKLILLLALLSFIISCATVPITGRKQLSLIPSAEINAMSFTSYREFLSENEVVSTGKDADLVKKVGLNIQKAVEEYFAMQNMSAHLNGYEWEFKLVKDETINAWCMPGGKVVFYTGILPVCENELGIAVVMGHEVAHAVAGHGNERMSQGLMVQLGGMALQKALDQKPE